MYGFFGREGGDSCPLRGPHRGRGGVCVIHGLERASRAVARPAVSVGCPRELPVGVVGMVGCPEGQVTADGRRARAGNASA